MGWDGVHIHMGMDGGLDTRIQRAALMDGLVGRERFQAAVVLCGYLFIGITFSLSLPCLSGWLCLLAHCVYSGWGRMGRIMLVFCISACSVARLLIDQLRRVVGPGFLARIVGSGFEGRCLLPPGIFHIIITGCLDLDLGWACVLVSFPLWLRAAPSPPCSTNSQGDGCRSPCLDPPREVPGGGAHATSELELLLGLGLLPSAC